MQYAIILLALVSISEVALAHPGHGKLWVKRLAEIKERAVRPPDGPNESNELLGDLVKAQTSQVGKDVAAILVGQAESQSADRIGPVAKLGSPECAKDKCCVWKYVADEMTAKFKGESGRCNNFARASVRLAFHDAGTWQKGNPFGGADGSMILTNEVTRPINKGLEEIVDAMKGIYAKYKPFGVSAADLIQVSGTVATVTCPLGPRIRTFVGRKDDARLPPDGLLPDVRDPADKLIDLFEKKTIKAHGLAALVGAHTTSQQRFFDVQKALDPQDSTPGVWDVKFYPETLERNPPKRVLKFPSDVVLSTHPKIAEEWKEFAGPGGQEHWNDDFAKEMVRLSLLGVNNINEMTECTKVLPPKTDRVFNAPDRPQVAKWSNGGYLRSGTRFGELISIGKLSTNETLAQNGIDVNDGGPTPPPEQNPAGAPQPGSPPQAPNNQPPNGSPRAGQPPNGPPLNGQNPNNQPQNGRPRNGQQPPNGRPRPDQPQQPNGQNPNGRPNRPQNGQPQNNQPGQEQQIGNRPQADLGQNPQPNGQPALDAQQPAAPGNGYLDSNAAANAACATPVQQSVQAQAQAQSPTYPVVQVPAATSSPPLAAVTTSAPYIAPAVASTLTPVVAASSAPYIAPAASSAPAPAAVASSSSPYIAPGSISSLAPVAVSSNTAPYIAPATAPQGQAQPQRPPPPQPPPYLATPPPAAARGGDDRGRGREGRGRGGDDDARRQQGNNNAAAGSGPRYVPVPVQGGYLLGN